MSESVARAREESLSLVEGVRPEVLLGWQGGRVSSIRDFRCVPYVAAEADFVEMGPERTADHHGE